MKVEKGKDQAGESWTAPARHRGRGLIIVLIILLLLSLGANAWLYIQRTKKPTTQPVQTQVDESDEKEDETGFIELTDQGVQIDPGEVEGLTAFVAPFEGGYYVYFSARSLDALAYKLLDGDVTRVYSCTAVNGPIGAMSLYEPDTPYQEPGDDIGKPAKDVLQKLEGTDYYVNGVSEPQSFCSEDAEITNLQTSLVEKAKSIKMLAL